MSNMPEQNIHDESRYEIRNEFLLGMLRGGVAGAVGLGVLWRGLETINDSQPFPGQFVALGAVAVGLVNGLHDVYIGRNQVIAPVETRLE